MQELSLERKKLKVSYEGKEYYLSKPSLGRCLELEKQMKESEDQSQPVLNFVASCGMPKEVLLEMDIELFEAIVEALRPKKKG